MRIGIVGCGPAGLACALYLSRAGHAATLLERFEGPRPVGSGIMLQETGLAVLADLGLAGRVLSLGHRLDRLLGRDARTGRTVLDVRFDQALGRGRSGLAVTRHALFDTLRAAVDAAGVRTVHSFEAAASDVDGGDRWVVAADGRREGPFDLVVDASGSSSRLLGLADRPSPGRPLGWGAVWTTVEIDGGDELMRHALEQRYTRASSMAGILPAGRRSEGEPERAVLFWSLRRDGFEAMRASGAAGFRSALADFWPTAGRLAERVEGEASLAFASYYHRTLPLPYGDRIAFVGDAAHCSSPQLGQGCNHGLLDAAALARSVAGTDDAEGALRAYAAMRRRHVRLYQAMSAAFTPLYQSDSRVLPAIRDIGGPAAMAMPGAGRFMAALVSGRMPDPLPWLGLAAPDLHASGAIAAGGIPSDCASS